MMFSKEDMIDFSKYTIKENDVLHSINTDRLFNEWISLRSRDSTLNNILSKKILYIDMDGVVANFDKRISELCPDIHLCETYEERSKKVDQICLDEEEFFHNLDPIDGSIEAVKKLSEHYEVYFLSSAMWYVPHSFTGKREWIHKHFGDFAKKRLILSHRKDLNMGSYLIDDRTKNGASEFNGEHIHFGTEKFSNWEKVINYLI